MHRKLLVYELNEVPWDLYDWYVARRPRSTMAMLARRSGCYTSHLETRTYLEPWRTWPAVHRSLPIEDHGSLDLGQDPSTIKGVPIWEHAARSGLRVGVFGQLQSWPMPAEPSFSFYVPDTFARTPEVTPASLRRFQALQLRLTSENLFTPKDNLPLGEVTASAYSVLRAGVTPRTFATSAWALGRERLRPKYRAMRSVLQADPNFDVYRKQVRTTRPHLAMFFTNHVAGMMHRFWGDLPETRYDEHEDYVPDPEQGDFVMRAMDVADRHLRQLSRFVDASPDYGLVVMSGMGQGAIPYRDLGETYVLHDSSRLLATLGLPSAEAGLAMYPSSCLAFASHEDALTARDALEEVLTDDGPLFSDFRLKGRTLHFLVDEPYGRSTRTTVVVPDGTRRPLADIGVKAETRLGRGNTAHHIPEGIALFYGDDFLATSHRDQVDALDLTPTLLGYLGLEKHPEMQGSVRRDLLRGTASLA